VTYWRRFGEPPRTDRPSRARAPGIALFLRLVSDRRAVSALEYGLIASMIAVVVVFAITSADINLDNLGAKFTNNVGAVFSHMVGKR
jgi:Flp pilus assembly pilin Flp